MSMVAIDLWAWPVWTCRIYAGDHLKWLHTDICKLWTSWFQRRFIKKSNFKPIGDIDLGCVASLDTRGFIGRNCAGHDWT